MDDDPTDQHPADIDEAIEYMREALAEFHASNDKRAVFLRLYYIMTLEVHAAIKQVGCYSGTTVFLDPDWVRLLSGKFSWFYFHSLTTFERPDCETAWKLAHAVAGRPGSTVVENALLGINAHINYDLPRAISWNLASADLDDYAVMQRRKFDHDQVNNLLDRVLEGIQDTLARDYEPGIAVADALMGRLDERMSEFALKYYRERVWWDAVAFAAAQQDGRKEEIVRAKLDWESAQHAHTLLSPTLLWRAERGLNSMVFWRRPKPWTGIVLEETGGAELPPPAERRRATALSRPNPRRRLARFALDDLPAK